MKTPDSSEMAVAQKKLGATEVITPESDNLHGDGVMTRSRLKRLSESNTKDVCKNRKMSFGTPSSSVNSITTRRALLRSLTESPEKVSVTPKSTSNRKSRRSILSEAKSITSSGDNSVIHERRRPRIDKSLKSDNDGGQHVTNAGGSVSVALFNAVENQDSQVTITISGLCSNLKSVVLVNDTVKNGTKECNDTNSKVNSPLRVTELVDGPLILSNNYELSPNCSQKQRKVKKSRKSKSSPSNKNEWDVSTISEPITELENGMDVVKSPQKLNKHKTYGNPIVSISPLPAEIYESVKSPDYTGSRETHSKNSTDTESALVDKACEVNKRSDTDVYEPQDVSGSSAEKTHKKEEKFEKYNETEGDEILEDIEAGRLDSDKEISVRKSTDTDSVSAASTRKEHKQSGMKSPIWEGTSSENHYISNNSIQDSGSQTKCMENSCGVKSSPVYKTHMRKEMRSESSEPDSDAESRKAIMESAQKRIIQNISTSESESKKLVKPFTKSTRPKDTSDSDSAPENMSFSAGRQLVMESLKNAVESVQREKHRRKEKRKERLEKYKQQKEEKLIRLKEKRASQEDASCSSSEESGYEEVDVPSEFGKSNKKQGVKREKENVDELPQSKVKRFHSDDEAEPKERKEKKRKREQEDKDVSQHFGNLKKLPDDVLENLPDQVPVKLQKMDNEAASKEKRRHEKHNKYGGVKDKRQATDFRNRSDVDYIPLSTCGATEFGVMPLDDLMRAPKSLSQQAAEFKQNMLFGSRIKRGPANTQTVYQQKLKASGKGRLVR